MVDSFGVPLEFVWRDLLVQQTLGMMIIILKRDFILSVFCTASSIQNLNEESSQTS